MEENKIVPDSTGNIKISDEVVVTIASVAVSEIDGVCGTGAGLVEGFARKFAKKPSGGGIKVTMTDSEVAIDVNVIMNYGVRIPEVAWNVQDAVKREVELMTGLTVTKVNVRVVGIEVPQAEQSAVPTAEDEQTTEE